MATYIGVVPGQGSGEGPQAPNGVPRGEHGGVQWNNGWVWGAEGKAYFPCLQVNQLFKSAALSQTESRQCC